MTDEQWNNTDPVHEAPPLWHATELLRRHLGVGAVAALLAGGLSAASAVLELREGRHAGFTVATALDLTTVLPQIMVLVAWQLLGRDLPSQSLRTSSWGTFVSLWLLQAFNLALMDIWQNPFAPFWILLGAAVGLVWLLASTSKGAPGVVVAAGIAFIFLVRVVHTIVAARKPNARLESSIFLAEQLALFLSWTGFTLWFALTLIRHRRQLGDLAGAVGLAHVAVVAVWLIYFAWLLTATLNSPDQPAGQTDGVGEPERERQLALVAGALADVASALFTAFLLGALRHRIETLSGSHWDSPPADSTP